MPITADQRDIQANYLANYLPSGDFWNAKYLPESNLRKILRAFGQEFQNVEESVKWLKRELSIFTTVDLIEFWEDMYGIPDLDGVFVREGKTIEQRRKNLYIKELMDGADMVEDWEKIAFSFGFRCKVYPARKIARFPLSFPFTFTDVPTSTIIVDFYNVVRPSEFPQKFPIVFGDGGTSIIKKVFEIIKPADCIVMYNYIDS